MQNVHLVMEYEREKMRLMPSAFQPTPMQFLFQHHNVRELTRFDRAIPDSKRQFKELALIVFEDAVRVGAAEGAKPTTVTTKPASVIAALKRHDVDAYRDVMMRFAIDIPKKAESDVLQAMWRLWQKSYNVGFFIERAARTDKRLPVFSDVIARS